MKTVIRIEALETRGGVGSTAIRGRGSVTMEDLSLLEEFDPGILIRNAEGSNILNHIPTTVTFSDKVKPSLSAIVSLRGSQVSEQNILPGQHLSICLKNSEIKIADKDSSNTLTVTRES